MIRTMKYCCLAVLVLSSFPGTAQAQVVREQGAGTIAGVLEKLDGAWIPDEFSFSSFGGEILVADLDAELFIVPGSEGGGCEETATATTAPETEGGCTCGDDEGGSGAGQFILTVLDLSGEVVCQAGRPKRPGWERDPRIACYLESPGDYLLRVGRGHMGGESPEVTTAGAQGPGKFVYLLTVSLRKVAKSGPMIQSLTSGRSLFPRQN